MAGPPGGNSLPTKIDCATREHFSVCLKWYGPEHWAEATATNQTDDRREMFVYVSGTEPELWSKAQSAYRIPHRSVTVGKGNVQAGQEICGIMAEIQGPYPPTVEICFDN